MLRNNNFTYKHPSDLLLNSIQKDNRIYYTDDPYTAITISPFHQKFESQIEKGIWPIVNALNSKGFYTLSSCEGHSYKGLPNVIFVFRDKNVKDDFVNNVSKIKGITVRDTENNKEFLNSLFNVDYDMFTEKAIPKKHDNSFIPVDELNYIFKANSDNYWVIELRINSFFDGRINFWDFLLFKNYFTKKKLLKFIEAQPFHY